MMWIWSWGWFGRVTGNSGGGIAAGGGGGGGGTAGEAIGLLLALTKAS